MRYVVSGLAAVLFCVLISNAASVPTVQEKKPKYTVKQVMKAHKGRKNSLLAKVALGKADEKEVKMLVEYYTALAANPCPSDEKDDWKKRTGKLLKLAKKAKAGEKMVALFKAANCKGCHSIHK
ncbi:MAG: hypothetical protein ACFCD0_02710 [Gemmataceae bacterium]